MKNSNIQYGTLVRCFLAEPKKRITSPSFKVFIPSMMPSITDDDSESKESVSAKMVLNQDSEGKNILTSDPEVEVASSIEARSIHNYFHRLDGWIPEYLVDTSTYETITSETGSHDKFSTTTVIDFGPAGHTHALVRPAQLEGTTLNKNVSKTMVHTRSTEVDFQDLHKGFIYRGAEMYGCFLDGGQFEFVILAIKGATPYLDETEYNAEYSDNPHTYTT